MSHPKERRTQLRGLYVFKRLSMEAACNALKIAKSTGIRWKGEARDDGDDWDSARAAIALGDENFSQLSKKLLEDYLVQHQASIEQLRADQTLTALQRANVLASMADSFNKTMASFKRLAPELNRHAVALDTLQRLASFAQQRYPHAVPALLELLEPFGEELAKAYG
ncbi:MAG: DUF1804 family protein [Roseateles sp.]|nr:MAG: DUF1804 family protein [Roseateles sp.]